jgi:hypothetical protein
MKNGFLLSVLTTCLIGCGGESGDETPTEITDFSSSLKGIEDQPILTNAEISEGDNANLNINYTGNVIEHSSVQFSFTLAEDKQVAFVLSSEIQNLDLSIYGNDKSLNSEFEGSNELIVVDTTIGETYIVEVASQEGSGEFQLKIVEANRSSVGLSSGEYLISFDTFDAHKCTENGYKHSDRIYNYSSFEIINWSDGYIDDIAREDRRSLDDVHNHSHSLIIKHLVSEVGMNLSGQGEGSVLTDFVTGEVTMTLNGSYEYTQGYREGSCTYASIATGNVIL